MTGPLFGEENGGHFKTKYRKCNTVQRSQTQKAHSILAGNVTCENEPVMRRQVEKLLSQKIAGSNSSLPSSSF